MYNVIINKSCGCHYIELFQSFKEGNSGINSLDAVAATSATKPQAECLLCFKILRPPTKTDYLLLVPEWREDFRICSVYLYLGKYLNVYSHKWAFLVAGVSFSWS